MPQNRTIAWAVLACSLLGVMEITVQAATLDTIGVTLLRQVTTNLNGSTIHVGQAEGQLPPPPAGAWEVNPTQTSPAVNLLTNLFSYHSNTVANGFPNSLGVESAHADTVAENFYGRPSGVATNVAHIDVYEADYFIGVTVPNLVSISNKIVNQSFVAGLSQQIEINTNYDNYAANFGTLFVSAVGDGGNVNPPATCYNGIGVAAYGGASSIGPTTDNKRSKPDITAPADATSDSTPLVSGAATILLQAANRGDGGSDTNSASDARTLKALLLNGAIKPSDWTNNSSVPLDQRYGAGVLNVFESYEQLTGGKHAFIASSKVAVGGAHPPTGSTNNIISLYGWEMNTNTSSSTNDTINHYYFKLTGSNVPGGFTATATLVWDRQPGKTAINELDLYLYNAATSNMVAVSSNSIDNVKHIFIPQLAPGRYDLQVLKKGGSGTNFVTASADYALAFEFFETTLHYANSGANVVLTWPVYPAGFALQSTSNLNPPVTWNAVNITPAISNNQNSVTVSAGVGNQFFRLARQ